MKKFAISNIVRIFANDIRDMEKKKDYTVTQEQLARFAKALGHPARIAIMHFLAKQKTCYFGDIHEELPNTFCVLMLLMRKGVNAVLKLVKLIAATIIIRKAIISNNFVVSGLPLLTRRPSCDSFR